MSRSCRTERSCVSVVSCAKESCLGHVNSKESCLGRVVCRESHVSVVSHRKELCLGRVVCRESHVSVLSHRRVVFVLCHKEDHVQLRYTD